MFYKHHSSFRHFFIWVFFIGRSKAVVLLHVFLCQSFSDVSPYVCSYYLSLVWIADWPSFGKELLTRLTICSLCILTICNFVIPHFGFEGWIWFLIASVSGLCILFTFLTLNWYSNIINARR